MDISKLSDIELKALAFDLISQRDAANQNLDVVIKLLAGRAQAAQVASADKLAEEPAE